MGAFVVRRQAEADVVRVWQVLTDFAGYHRWIPLTVMQVDPGSPAVGWSFAGLTGLGRVRFCDPMTLQEWSPPTPQGPGQFELRKHGRLLAGWARVRVAPGPRSGTSSIEWTEEIVVRPERLGRLLARVTDPVNRRLFARALGLMIAEAERPVADAGS
ncbi:MAG TPA: SRPBCC family protein [Dermatophilaceae bacterium]|nr:SRPBCC family protein [Dermatophilaceae bacterium]